MCYENDFLPDDCCLLPNQIMIPQLHQGNSITAIATPVLFYQNYPLQVRKPIYFLVDVLHCFFIFYFISNFIFILARIWHRARTIIICT